MDKTSSSSPTKPNAAYAESEKSHPLTEGCIMHRWRLRLIMRENGLGNWKQRVDDGVDMKEPQWIGKKAWRLQVLSRGEPKPSGTFEIRVSDGALSARCQVNPSTVGNHESLQAFQVIDVTTLQALVWEPLLRIMAFTPAVGFEDAVQQRLVYGRPASVDVNPASIVLMSHVQKDGAFAECPRNVLQIIFRYLRALPLVVFQSDASFARGSAEATHRRLRKVEQRVEDLDRKLDTIVDLLQQLIKK